MSIRHKAHKRTVLYEIQGGLCIHCAKPMPSLDSDAGRSRRATFEHVKPKSQGGTDAWANLTLAHGHCNHRRGVGPLWRGAKKRAKIVADLVAQPPE